ncbi:MAG TPA: hypothetical protein VFK41_07490 [Nocardioidaceae bacterium]|nr:hypothetical protein [Nocardioidaceae bacterium]
MSKVAASFRALPFIARVTLGIGMTCGLVGAMTGLMVGLDANPGTAWFAVIELGLPAFVSGCFLGFFGGLAWQSARDRT